MAEDVTGYFTPESQNAALIFLGRIIGCTMKGLWSAGGGGGQQACSDANDLVATLAKTFNLGALALIAIVATYLIFAAIKNTALDGEAGGRGANPGWTLVGAAMAAILCIPLSGGFSALQIGVMQVAVWSSGFGDKVWSASYDKMFSSAATTSAFTNDRNDAAQNLSPLRTSIAAAISARAQGDICSRALPLAVGKMGTVEGATITPAEIATSAATGDGGRPTGFEQQQLRYNSGTGFRELTGICGSVTTKYPKADAASLDAAKGDLYGDEQARDRLSLYISEAGRRVSAAVAKKILTSVQAKGDELGKVIAPDGSAMNLGPDTMTKIGGAIDQVMSDAISTAESETKKALSEGRLAQLTEAARSDITKRGWMFAVMYQRILVNAVAARQGVGSEIAVSSLPPEKDLSALIGCKRGIFGGTACGELEEIFLADYQRVTANYEQIGGAFSRAAANSSATGTNSATLPGLGNQEGWTSQIGQSLVSFVSGVEDNNESGAGWVDPIPQLQVSGGTAMGTGAAIAGVSATASWIGDKLATVAPGFGGAIDAIGTLGYPIGLFLFFVGFVLAIIVPMMPLFFFFAAGVSWLMSVCQAIFTAPFYLMQMFYPNTHGGLQGTGFGKMLLLLLGIIIRPALVIVGLLLCMVLMRAGLDIWNIFCRNGYAVLAGNSGLGDTLSLTKVVLVLGSFVVYTAGAAALVGWCCQFISGLADAAMDAVEAGASRLFADSGRSGFEGALAGGASGALASRMIARPTGSTLSGVRQALSKRRTENQSQARSLSDNR